MYTDFYRLSGFPFQLTPDHRFFFDSSPHRKAMAYLQYGLSKGEGFIVITGEIGTGKTTLIDHLLATLHGQKIATARIVTSQLEADDLVALAARGFGCTEIGGSKASLLADIEDRLTENRKGGLRSFLVIDEVQSLGGTALEELRMLSNFGLGPQPILQICLVGQPEFRTTLAGDRFEQLRQRIIASHHLYPLDVEETRGYVGHRLAHVGWQDDPRFEDGVFEAVHRDTGGVPRKINLLCDRLLLFGYLEEKHDLTVGDVEEVIIDMREEFLGPVGAADVGAGDVPGAPDAAAPAGAAPNDVEAIRSRIAELERLLPAATAGAGARPDAGETATAADPELRELDDLLHRVGSLRQQLKGASE